MTDSTDTRDTNAANDAVWLEGTAQYSVYYEDTDFSGYVYHANYLKYFDRGREELVGLGYVRQLYDRGLHYVVAKMELSFKRPARHGDRLEIRTRMRLGSSPVAQVEQEARLVTGNPTDAPLLVSAAIKLVAVDGKGEPTRIPADVLAHFTQLATGLAGREPA